MDTVKRAKISPQKAMIVGLIISLLAASGEGSHLGIGGDADGKGEVPMAGCTCHSAQPDNSVTIILDGVPPLPKWKGIPNENTDYWRS